MFLPTRWQQKIQEPQKNTSLDQELLLQTGNLAVTKLGNGYQSHPVFPYDVSVMALRLYVLQP